MDYCARCCELVAQQETSVENLWYTGWCDITFAKEKQWLLGKYLKNEQVLGKGYHVVYYSMSVTILPCYNQHQVPWGTWYCNPALERLP